MNSEQISIGRLSEQTGIPVDTLRTWERRYGHPVAHKLPSGHRRYDVAEIERLRGVRRLLVLGWKASDALSLDAEEIEAHLEEARDRVDILDEQRVETCLEFLREHALFDIEEIITQTRAERDVLAFLQDFVIPLMSRVGREWSRGELQIYEEHLISETVQRQISSRWHMLARQFTKQDRERPVLLGLLPEERHTLGLHMAALLITERGLPVINLETDTPLEQLASAAASTNARALMLSVSTYPPREHVEQQLETLARQLPEAVPLLVGSARELHFEGILCQDFSALDAWLEAARVVRT
jgi:DNA-binding transcriptional MerR regulator